MTECPPRILNLTVHEVDDPSSMTRTFDVEMSERDANPLCAMQAAFAPFGEPHPCVEGVTLDSYTILTRRGPTRWEIRAEYATSGSVGRML
jgi:hypothetical protein